MSVPLPMGMVNQTGPKGFHRISGKNLHLINYDIFLFRNSDSIFSINYHETKDKNTRLNSKEKLIDSISHTLTIRKLSNNILEQET